MKAYLRKIYKKILNNIVNIRCPINIKDSEQFKKTEYRYPKVSIILAQENSTNWGFRKVRNTLHCRMWHCSNLQVFSCKVCFSGAEDWGSWTLLNRHSTCSILHFFLHKEDFYAMLLKDSYDNLYVSKWLKL